ncbi:MAG: hypothetical protein LBS42_01035 [Tannerella sp.]|nr:hypothetical protein [Tannerella sp.]
MKINRLLLFCLMASLTGTLYAQSFYEVKTGARIATKTGINTLEVTGSKFVLRDGRMITTWDGELREDLGVKYYRRENNQVNYYNADEQLVGYYLPDVKRFVRIEARSEKEDYIAVIVDGQIYTMDEKPTFRIDSGFEPELVGLVLFFFLGYA